MSSFELPAGYSGAALVAHGREVLWSGAAGVADPATGRPCEVSTPFNFASVGKMFVASTAAALGVNFDAPVAPLVPELADAVGPATLRHLLSHTSGMGDVFDLPEYARRRTELVTLADWLALVAATRPAAAPGERWIYSNAAFITAGAVLERLTGTGWEELVRAHVLDPAGMRATGYPPLVGPEAPADLAVPWSAELNGDARGLHVVRGTPGGGGVTTVGDLHRFAVWIRQQPWAPALWEQVPWREGEGESYGTGFFVDGPVVSHIGNFWGISARLAIDRERDLIIAALANADPPAAEAVVDAALAQPSQRGLSLLEGDC